MRHIMRFSALLLACSLMTASLPETAVFAEDTEVFFDDFSGSHLDTDRWLIAQKNWGGKITVDGKQVDYNGGVVADNVFVSGGSLRLTGHGDLYTGDIPGINRDGSLREDGKRCGAAIATKDYFGSGSYEIRAKIAPELGCCSAMWTFEYEEDYSGDDLKVINHEIDIEFPGRNAKDEPSLDHVLCTTWVGEGDDEHKTGSPMCGVQTDGEFHTYRFDWHTGSGSEVPRVDYYFDGELLYTSYEYIPTNAGRFWLGLWFPRYWAGSPDFDTEVFEVDYAKITPFHESGDTPQNESYPDSGWAEDVFVPGDVSGDGDFNVSDLLLLQKWLLGVPETHLANWRAGDLCNDERLDTSDLCCARELYISK